MRRFLNNRISNYNNVGDKVDDFCEDCENRWLPFSRVWWDSTEKNIANIKRKDNGIFVIKKILSLINSISESIKDIYDRINAIEPPILSEKLIELENDYLEVGVTADDKQEDLNIAIYENYISLKNTKVDKPLIESTSDSLKIVALDNQGESVFIKSSEVGKVKSVNNKIGDVILKTSDLENDSDYTTNATLSTHTSNKANPHNVTKEQVGLGNVDNTSDLNKPISTATQTELNKKLDKPTTNNTNQFVILGDGSTAPKSDFGKVDKVMGVEPDANKNVDISGVETNWTNENHRWSNLPDKSSDATHNKVMVLNADGKAGTKDAGDLGKNFSNTDLEVSENRKHTGTASVELAMPMIYSNKSHRFSGLIDKSADATYDKVMVLDDGGNAGVKDLDFVPYTGANKSIDLNTQNFRIGGDFNKSFSSFESSHLSPNETTYLHFTRLTDVASFSRGNDSTTQSDCIAITLPIRTTTRWVMEVDIYSNAPNGIFKGTPTKLLISAYNTNNSLRSVTVTSGVDDVKSISFCRDENKNTVIIIRPQDGVETNFTYGKVNIANFYHSVTYKADLAVKSNYKVEAVLESSLTGLTTNGTITNAQFTRDSYYLDFRNFTNVPDFAKESNVFAKNEATNWTNENQRWSAIPDKSADATYNKVMVLDADGKAGTKDAGDFGKVKTVNNQEPDENGDIPLDLDAIPLSGTVEGKPVTGTLEFQKSDTPFITVKDSDKSFDMSYDNYNTFSAIHTYGDRKLATYISEGGLVSAQIVGGEIKSNFILNEEIALLSTTRVLVRGHILGYSDYSNTDPTNKQIYTQRSYVDAMQTKPTNWTNANQRFSGLVDKSADATYDKVMILDNNGNAGVKNLDFVPYTGANQPVNLNNKNLGNVAKLQLNQQTATDTFLQLPPNNISGSLVSDAASVNALPNGTLFYKNGRLMMKVGDYGKNTSNADASFIGNTNNINSSSGSIYGDTVKLLNLMGLGYDHKGFIRQSYNFNKNLIGGTPTALNVVGYNYGLKLQTNSDDPTYPNTTYTGNHPDMYEGFHLGTTNGFFNTELYVDIRGQIFARRSRMHQNNSTGVNNQWNIFYSDDNSNKTTIDWNADTLNANIIKKVGGTASQFLKADGSVDTNTYALASSIPTNSEMKNLISDTLIDVLTNSTPEKINQIKTLLGI